MALPSLLSAASSFPFLLCPTLAEHPLRAGRWLVSCPVLEGSWILLAQCLHGARKSGEQTLLRAVSTIHCRSIPLGAQGLVGGNVWPAQCGSGLSWRSPWQAAPTTVCTAQGASPLRGGYKSETSQQHLCMLVLDFSVLFLPSPAPRNFVMQLLDTRRVK